MEKTFLLCDCLGSQDIDAPALSKATGLPCSKVYSCLCTAQIGTASPATMRFAASVIKGASIAAAPRTANRTPGADSRAREVCKDIVPRISPAPRLG